MTGFFSRTGRRFYGPVASALITGGNADTVTVTPAANLSGTWTGTVTVEASPADDWETCREPVTANLTQNGSAVVGPLNDDPSPRQCLQGRFSFFGTLEGRNLLGKIEGANYRAYGQVEGERGDHLKLTAMNVIFELDR